MNSSVLKRNNVKITGDGSEVLLFLHGFGCDQVMWRLVAPAFAQDHKVVTLDYVGQGGSDIGAYSASRYSTLAGYAADVTDVLSALDLRRVTLIGHSVSSMIAMLASFAEPERVERMIFVSPSPCYLNDPPYHGGFEKRDLQALVQMMDQNYIGWANALGAVVVSGIDQPQFRREFIGSLCSTDPAIAKNFAHATFFSDNRADLAHIRVPVLILQCSEDAVAPMDVGRYMAEKIEGSTLAVLDTIGHCPHLTAPAQTIAAMRSFLDATRPGRPST